MIDLYTWPTPNGRKISIALEELGLDYRAHAVNIGKDEQFAPEFLAISPNNKIPAIVDDGRSLMESGAILLYLSDLTGRLAGSDRWTTLEWLMLQMGGVGPMLGPGEPLPALQRGQIRLRGATLRGGSRAALRRA